ncbi:MAG: hypothetical protein LBE59_08310 [Nevskiaceae bacterium]|jgi:hypothetical protein|nr:hypothetical protein [Nevskiaceae bacterium]
MRTGPIKVLALAAGLIVAAPALAQKMPDIGFKSVGRGAPLAASVLDMKQEVGPNWIRGQGVQASDDPKAPFPLNGYTPDKVPANYQPLPRDIFTSPDFYADKALWSDPRYYRCNSPQATEYQRGILQRPAVNTSDKIEDAPWGHCEVSLPREAIVSPYGFKTAQEHYEALKAETTQRGGPSVYTYGNFPNAEWNGVYERPARSGNNQINWYWGRHTQIPTVLSVLTPKYQEYMVQEAYHQMRGDALWPSTFCWPEGFMRRWYPAAVWEHYIVATPDFVEVRAGVARNFIQDIYVGRDFNMQDVPNGGVPRLGQAVPRWYGETVGFWDKDVLITWTSNIQGWKSHSEFEFSNKLQSIEIYTPIREGGKFIGLNHETILYDEDALAVPVRIVRNFHKINDFKDNNEVPYAFIECVQTLFNVEGRNTPLTPGAKIEYEMPDMYGRPWAKIWSENFEQNMTKPEDTSEDIFDFSK